jgi:hypothetical protein
MGAIRRSRSWNFLTPSWRRSVSPSKRSAGPAPGPELLVEIGEVAQAAQSGALFLIDEMR